MACGYGSELDLISEGMLKTANATNRRVSDTPICLATAKGSTRADEVADLTVDALHKDFTPYILDETPAVLSVGVRCMEQGYSFVWPEDSKPYFIRTDHTVIALNVDGRVPVIGPSCKVISGKQFKKDCKLVKLFAMASRSSDADEAEGVDEGVPTDDGAEYVRSRKTSDSEVEAKSSHHQCCHYPKTPFARYAAMPTGTHDGAACQKERWTKALGNQVLRQPYRS